MRIYQKSILHSMEIIRGRLQGPCVLDVGGACCPQRSTIIASWGFNAAVCDIGLPHSPLAAGVRLIHKPVEELTVADGIFEDILISNVLEHVEKPEHAIRSLRAVAAPGARIHILTPNCESLNRRIGVRMGVLPSIRTITDAEKAIGHVHAFCVIDILEMLTRAGLRVAEVRGVFLKPVPTDEMIQWPDTRIQAFFDIAAEIPPELCHEVYLMAECP